MFKKLFTGESMTVNSLLSKMNLSTSKESAENDMVIEVEENQRFSNKNGWSNLNLRRGSDPGNYVYSDGTQTSMEFPSNMTVADGWEFIGEW